MIQIPNDQLSYAVINELRRLGDHYILARPGPGEPANVYWRSLEGKLRTVGCCSRACPALAEWFENDDCEVKGRAQHERDTMLHEIEEANRKESQELFEAHVAYWVERGVSRAEAVNLANTWATPEYAHRARVKAWRANRRAERGRRPAVNAV